MFQMLRTAKHKLVWTERYWMKTDISPFYEDYTDGRTRSVSSPIDGIKVDE